ncbi:cytochrome b/b6 domain-containing protein [Thiomicrorhabdus sp.]|uniref:cytochrome b/b6 domain-containing protein n=1 Tax=Thiomicrorhabdus sp. TaxID=2039724 RepID=UPI0029C8D41A|nr:cytochrome b/b6 domain-containing protein [Thiomicrorhabdus sp.]
MIKHDKPSVEVWDHVVRLFHWSVAVLFLASYWLTEGGSSIHEYCGYAVMLLVIARIFWGFIGSPNAVFKNFWPTAAAIKAQLKDFSSHPHGHGHSPLGALMVLTLLVLLLITSLSGWMRNWDLFWGEDWIQRLHEISAHILQFLVILHITSVILIQKYARINLIRGMITGKQKSR